MHYQYSAVFLDTSIFDGQNYNFGSQAFVAFLKVFKDIDIPLLLPDPIEREIRRHLRQRAIEAIDHLETARRKAPFIAEWPRFPKDLNLEDDTAQLQALADAAFEKFLKEVQVVRIDYKNVNLPKVMDWYEKGSAPFSSKGSKRKEFPDALAFEMVLQNAMTYSTVAVVSADKDFQRACEQLPNVLYVESLPKLTQNLLAEPEKVNELIYQIEEDIEKLEASVFPLIRGLPFYDFRGNYEIFESEFTRIYFFELIIVGLGDNGECTLFFYAEAETVHKARWTSSLTPPEWARGGAVGVIKNSAAIGGSVKLAVKDGKIESVGVILLDDDEIPILQLPGED